MGQENSRREIEAFGGSSCCLALPLPLLGSLVSLSCLSLRILLTPRVFLDV